jgi:hypothetical protein
MRVCEGLISEGIEPITEEESDWLRRRAGRNRRDIKVYFLGAVLFFALLIACLGLIGYGAWGALPLAVLVSLPILSMKLHTGLRPIKSAHCQWVEVFRERLPEVSFNLEIDRLEDDFEWEDELQPDTRMRRLIPTGEVIRWDGSRMIEPYHAPVLVPPAVVVENSAPTRTLNAGERSELFRSQWESWVGAILLLFAGVGVAWVSAQNPHDSSLAAVIGVGVINSVALWLFLLGLFHLFSNSKANDLRDGRAYLNGQQEKLASGRLWRFDGVPALERWKDAKD